jgi:hypothetical protein
MRSRAVTVGLLVMLGALAWMVLSREREPHVMPPPAPAPAAEAHAGSDAAVAIAGDAATSPIDATAEAVAVMKAEPDAHALAPMDRVLRVVALGWEALAPGIVANGGRSASESSAFRSAHVDVELAVAPVPAEVEKRLARGGADAEGADVAIVPLPAFVAAYERLRALEPQAFLVVGWSRGREGVFGAKDGMLARARTDETRLAAIGDAASTALALFALDASGTSLARVGLVNDSKGAQLAAVVRPFPTDAGPDTPSKLLLTTADASRLVPIVAVASRGLVESRAKALEAWARVWLEGIERMRADVPAAARLIAAEPNAPEPAALLERFGQVDGAGAADEARVFGLAGHDAATVNALFALFWRLARETGSLTSPAPEPMPIATAVAAAATKAAKPVESDVGAGGAAPSPGGKVLLAWRVSDAKLDEAAVVAQVSLLASVFERSTVRVSARSAATLKSVTAAVYDRNEAVAARVVSGRAPTDGSAVVVEVVAAP